MQSVGPSVTVYDTIILNAEKKFANCRYKEDLLAKIKWDLRNYKDKKNVDSIFIGTGLSDVIEDSVEEKVNEIFNQAVKKFIEKQCKELNIEIDERHC